MKNKFFFLIAIFFTIHSYAQIEFEEGYIITNQNQQLNCLIKNEDWRSNPTEIYYKLDEDSEVRKAIMHNIKEFGIHKSSRYIKEKVQLDRSNDYNFAKMSESMQPEFKEEEVLLKVIIEGKASLYSYTDERLQRFFYKMNDSEIEPLIYKRYLIVSSSKIGSNQLFKQQLFNDFKCDDFSMRKFENLYYNEPHLSKIFIEYNECKNEDFINYNENKNKSILNFTIRPGVDLSNLLVESYFFDLENIQLDHEFSFRLGFEAEFILPFNKNKWGVFIEPTFQTYNSTKHNEDHNVAGNLIIANIKYNSFEFPMGARHYFYLNKNSKLFVNAAFLVHITLTNKSSLHLKRSDMTTYYKLDIESRPSFALGGGYKFNDKFSAELRYLTGREILSYYADWGSNFETISLILGYTLF